MQDMKVVYKALTVGILGAFTAFIFPGSALAAQQMESGDIIINSQVVGPPPSTPPTIDSPIDGTTFDHKQIEVKGSCVADLIVKVYRNNIFAGSALCNSNGTYGLFIDLYDGRNDLIARQYDAANQSSPDSNTVTVYYTIKEPTLPGEGQPQGQDGTIPSPSNQLPNGGAAGQSSEVAQFQLIIDYDYTLQSIFPNKPFRLPVKFAGGTAPYAINIDWGDGSNSVFSKDAAMLFNTDHTYKTPGYYTVKIKVSDKNGEEASLQFVLIVNGSTTSTFTAATFNAYRYWWWWAATFALLISSWAAAFIAGQLFQRHKLQK